MPDTADLDAPLEKMMYHILKAICDGSGKAPDGRKYVSPFLHFSTKREDCRQFLSDCIVKVDLIAMWRLGALSQHTMFDVSSPKHWDKLYGRDLFKYGDECAEMVKRARHLSGRKKEVLAKYRGNMALDACVVINDLTGEDIAPLRAILEKGGLTSYLSASRNVWSPQDL